MFGSINWGAADQSGNSLVQVFGFGSEYGSPQPNTSAAVVRSGDSLTLNIFDTNFGQPLSATVIAESPAQVTGLNVVGPPYTTLPTIVAPDNSSHWFFVNSFGLVTGTVIGSTNCGPGVNDLGIEGAQVNSTSNDSSDQFSAAPSSVGSSATNTFGFFAIGYTPSLAGTKGVTAAVTVTTHSISANATALIHPGLTSISPNIGPENHSVSLTGTGFSTQHQPSVQFGPKKATSIAVASSTNINVRTPAAPSALIDGYLQVDVIESEDGLDSLPVQYTYIVPGQPVLYPNMLTCQNYDLDVNIYNEEGNDINETVVLTANAPIFGSTLPVCSSSQSCPCQTSGSSAGTTTCVQAPGQVSVLRSGQVTITATPQLSPQQVLSAPFDIPPGFCVPGYFYDYLPNFLPQIGPVDPYQFVASVGLGGVAWKTSGDPFAASDFILMSGAIGLEKSFSVSSLSIYDLRALLRASRSVAIKGSEARAVNFTGKSLRLSANGAGGEITLKNPTELSFTLPNTGRSVSDYRIFRRSVSSGPGEWIEVPAIQTSRPTIGAIKASITETGIYALALVTPR